MEKLVQFFRLMSDETRLRIVLLLNNSSLCVCQISGILNLSQPNISKHLAKLRDIGLVVVERQEQYIYYSLNTKEERYMQMIQWIDTCATELETAKEDQRRIFDKEKFLNSCGTNPVVEGKHV